MKYIESKGQAMRTVNEQILSNATLEATHTLVGILLIMQLQMSFTNWSRYYSLGMVKVSLHRNKDI